MSQIASTRSLTPGLLPATRGLALPALFIATCLAGLSADPQFAGTHGTDMVTAGAILAATAALALALSGVGQLLSRSRVEIATPLVVVGFVASLAAYAVVGVYLFG